MRRYSNTVHLTIMAVFFWGFGIALIIATVFFFIDYKQDKANCTEKIKALVVDYKYIPPVDEEDDGDYRPIIEYEVNNTTYTKTLTNYPKNPKEGSFITIYYNPNNPEEIFYEDNTGLFMAPIGSAIFTVAGVFLTYLAIREHKKNKQNYYEQQQYS